MLRYNFSTFFFSFSFQCDVCFKEFRQPCPYKKHLQTHLKLNGDRIEPETVETNRSTTISWYWHERKVFNSRNKLFFIFFLWNESFFNLSHLDSLMISKYLVHWLLRVKHTFQQWKAFKSYMILYQTTHFFTGFILAPSGHWKSSENSLRLLRGPLTLKRLGECVNVFKALSCDTFKVTEQAVCAADTQKSCSGVRSTLGSRFSFPLLMICFLYARFEILNPALSAIFSPKVFKPLSVRLVESSVKFPYCSAMHLVLLRNEDSVSSFHQLKRFPSASNWLPLSSKPSDQAQRK